MVFSSSTFLFIFFPALLALYFIVPKKFRDVRNLILLGFSLAFYFYGEPKGILIMLASILGNYLFAYLISRAEEKRWRIAALVLSIVFNLGLLCYYKYTGFFLTNINNVLHTSIIIPKIIMPIGISFFTFQGMSYVFDVYKKSVPVQKNILNVALYISLFPQLVAGPIVRYETVAQEITVRNETMDKAAEGFRRFIFGLAKKMLLANPMGLIATEIFGKDAASLPWLTAWIGAIAYSFQIFYDFSGYSDMAIGLGKIFGFEFLENFNFPYIATSITDFWRRWHISLSGWFRDYVYIPLGGNRKGFVRQLVNILIVWLLTGLWHGASWNFVFWGLYFAVILIAEKLFMLKVLKKAWKPLTHIYSILLIIIGWVIFNSSSLSSVFAYIGSMFSFTTLPKSSLDYGIYTLFQYKFEFLFAILLSMPLIRNLMNKYKENQIFMLAVNIVTIALFGLSVLSVVNTSFNPFIYFRF